MMKNYDKNKYYAVILSVLAMVTIGICSNEQAFATEVGTKVDW